MRGYNNMITISRQYTTFVKTIHFVIYAIVCENPKKKNNRQNNLNIKQKRR